MTQTEFKETLVNMVKACGEELIDRAEDLVGDGEMLTDFSIYINFPVSVCRFDGVPTIDVNKSYQPTKTTKVLLDSLGA